MPAIFDHGFPCFLTALRRFKIDWIVRFTVLEAIPKQQLSYDDAFLLVALKIGVKIGVKCRLAKLISTCYIFLMPRPLRIEYPMDNHYHLLIRTPNAYLSRVMRHIHGIYTQYYNRSKKTDGPLFRGRYKAKLIDEDCYWLLVSRYIH